MGGFDTFEFDLSQALLEQVVAALDRMRAGQLTSEAVAGIPEAQGVYQLFLDGTLVYIGKTDAEAGLRQRLGRHRNRIQHRSCLDETRTTVKALPVFHFATKN